MKEILLTKGFKATVDSEDFDFLSKKKWFFSNGYAKNKSRNSVYMHRLILSPKKEEYVDHINGDKLDNRRVNLRICTMSQNLANQKLSRANTSGYKGVSFHKILGYWTATLKVKGLNKVKYFKNKEDAALGYNGLARRYFGDFAKHNEL